LVESFEIKKQGVAMKKIAILLWILSMPVAFAQSQNFEGFGLAIDYSLNSITD